MKKSFIKKISNRVLAISCLLLAFVACSGQPATKPYMWIPQQTSLDQITNFNNVKLTRIGDNCGSPQKNEFTLGNFWGFIDYLGKTYGSSFINLRVYIGICTGTLSVPKGMAKKLILIFAPMTSEDEKTVLNYYILPTRFDPSKPANFTITKSVKDGWANKFIEAMPLETIDQVANANQYPNSTDPAKTPSDTRYATYCAADFNDLVWLVNYYNTHGQSISENSLANLGAYSDNGNQRGQYSKRILIQFEFLDKKNQLFYLDTIPGFLQLSDGSSKCVTGFDNGQLCPTVCH